MVGRATSKVFWQREIEVIGAVLVSFAAHLAVFHHGNVRAGRFDLHRRAIHRLAEEIIRAHCAHHVVPGAVVPPGLAVLLVEIDRDPELRQYIALDIQRNLRGLCGARTGVTHKRAHMIRAEVHFVRQFEIR